MKKRQQRKRVRYGCKHSMSLWQGDWKEFEINESMKWIVAFMDDSSRLVTFYGVFDSPTTENTFAGLLEGFQRNGVPREILTDQGTQFVSARDRENAQHTFKEFQELNGIKHIVARVKHPQTNGKIERFSGEVERRIGKFGSADRIVEWGNQVKPHMSLNYQEPAKVSGTVFRPRGFSDSLRSGSMGTLISGFHTHKNSEKIMTLRGRSSPQVLT